MLVLCNYMSLDIRGFYVNVADFLQHFDITASDDFCHFCVVDYLRKKIDHFKVSRKLT